MWSVRKHHYEIWQHCINCDTSHCQRWNNSSYLRVYGWSHPLGNFPSSWVRYEELTGGHAQNRDERKQLIHAARLALDDTDLHDVPIVAGTGAASTRESIELCKDAADAGADYVMVIPPGYYSGPLISNSKAIEKFFTDIAQASPIPV